MYTHLRVALTRPIISDPMGSVGLHLQVHVLSDVYMYDNLELTILGHKWAQIQTMIKCCPRCTRVIAETKIV